MIWAALAIAQVPAGHKAPVFAGQSLTLVKQMEAALKKLNDVVITIDSEAGRTSIELLGTHVREEQPSVLWAFDGSKLYLEDKAKHLYVSGKCLRHRAVEVVSKTTHHRVDTFTRDLLLHRIPFEDGLLDAKVAQLGTAAPQGVLCDILEADGPEGKMSIFLRHSDHLPQSVSTATYVDGKMVSEITRNFSFAKLKTPNFVVAPKPTDKVGAFPSLNIEKV